MAVMVTDELIQRFLLQQCTREEALEIMLWLELNPSALDTWLPEDLAGEPVEKLPPELTGKMLAAIQQAGIARTRRIVRYRWMAAAAVLLLAMPLAWLQYKRIPLKQATGQAGMMEEIKNSTAYTQRLSAPDGSVIDLSAGTTLSYPKRFDTGNRRSVYLSGKALFQVSADKNRPFCVQAEQIIITVLGTSFSVAALPASDAVIVQLHSGKVVVSGVPPAGKYLKQDYYLQPGDILTYNKHTRTATVLKAHSKAPPIPAAARGSQKRQAVEQPDWYAFKGQPLSQVLDQLAEYYGADIHYRPAELTNKYFFGSFTRTDNLDTIIRDIALVNGLTLTREGNRYTLYRRQPVQ